MKTERNFKKEYSNEIKNSRNRKGERLLIYDTEINSGILKPVSTGWKEKEENGGKTEEKSEKERTKTGKAELINTKTEEEIAETEHNGGGKEAVHQRTEEEKTESNKCYNEDTPDIQKKKKEAIVKFYKDPEKLRQTEAMLSGLFRELFTGIEIDETAEDEIQNITESFLTKRKWNVEKKPDYGKQLIYVIRYNLIPNMLTKYYGRKKTNMSDEEIQLRNYYGTGHREKPSLKHTFTREIIKDFEINETEGMIVHGKEDTEGIYRIERASYETSKESKRREEELDNACKRIEKCDEIIRKKGNNEEKMLWEILKNANKQGKMNIAAGKIMNKTPDEIKVIKRRMKRHLGVYRG